MKIISWIVIIAGAALIPFLMRITKKYVNNVSFVLLCVVEFFCFFLFNEVVPYSLPDQHFAADAMVITIMIIVMYNVNQKNIKYMVPIVTADWLNSPCADLCYQDGRFVIAQNIAYIRKSVEDLAVGYTNEQKMFATACIDLFKHLSSGDIKVNTVMQAVHNAQLNIISINGVSEIYDGLTQENTLDKQSTSLAFQVLALASFINNSDPQQAVHSAITSKYTIEDAIKDVMQNPSDTKAKTIHQVVLLFFSDPDFVQLVKNFSSDEYIASFQEHIKHEASATLALPVENKKQGIFKNALIITSVISCILLVYSSIITFYPQAAEKLSAMATGSETYEEKYKKLKKKYDILKEDSEGADSANSDLIDQNVDLHEELYEAQDALDYVVFVGPDEYYYHSYDCPKLDMSSFLAFNTEAAIDEGYVPCSWCQE